MKKYIKCIGIFLFFIIIFFLSPISGDDWGNYFVGSEGLRHSIEVAINLYFNWEGRFISRIFINILTYHKWLWNIINSLLIVSTIYMGMKFIGKKSKKYIFPLMILVILFMNLYTFSQTITWLAGNMTYFFIIPVILWYFYYLLNNDEYSKCFSFIFVLINFFGTMFVENMAVVLIGGNILLILYKYIKNKRIDKKLIIYTFISILSTIIMLLSPGTRYRNSIENLEFNELSIFGKILVNIPNFIFYTFIANSYLLLLMSWSNYLIIKKKVNNKWLKFCLIGLVLIIPLLTVIIYPVSMFINTKLSFLINSSSIFVICYWLIYLIISLGLLISEDKKKLDTIFLFLVGLCSNVAMLISPTWGFRTSVFTYICLSIVALKTINKYVKEKNFFEYLCYSLVGCGAIFYLVLYMNVYKCQINLEKSIQKQLNENNNIIYIDEFPSFVNCNINPVNEYHIGKYKLYYDIPEDKQLVLVDGSWKYLIFYKK